MDTTEHIPPLYLSQSTRPGSSWATDGGTIYYRVIHRGMPVMADTPLAAHAADIYTHLGGKWPAPLWDGNAGEFTTTTRKDF